MSELFNIEETPSPRLVWMRLHKIRTHRSPSIPEGEEPWVAWLPEDEHDDTGIPIDMESCGLGETEDEAIVALAKLKNIPLWNKGGAK